nr:hypothetical protein [Fredinandcohnia onubensis]
MNEIRCTKCSKLLMKAKFQYEATNELADIEIQCTKNTCKVINRYKAK